MSKNGNTLSDSPDNSGEIPAHMKHWEEQQKILVAKLRASGLTVIEKEPSDSEYYEASFPISRHVSEL